MIGDGRSDYVFFNPSLVNAENSSVSNMDNFSAIISVRRDRVESTWQSWYGQSFILNRWNTQVVIGSTFQIISPIKYIAISNSVVIDINQFVPCMPPPVCNANGTLVVKVTSGPEDPRIFSYEGAKYISFFSYDNIIGANYSYGISTYDENYVGYYGTGTNLCIPTPDGLIGRMYVSKIYPSPPNECMLQQLVPIYQDGFHFTNNSIIKNWLAFSLDSELYFIHQISPQFIVTKISVMTETEWVATLHSSVTTPSSIIALDSYNSVDKDESSGKSAITSNIHGSVNPVLINSEISSWNTSYFLSIFHVLSNDPSSSYAAYAFAFCPYYSFNITALSNRLPLNLTGYSSYRCGGKFPFAFVSGIEIFPCEANSSEACLVISYGVCDQESRVSVMKLVDFETNMMTLFPSSY